MRDRDAGPTNKQENWSVDGAKQVVGKNVSATTFYIAAQSVISINWVRLTVQCLPSPRCEQSHCLTRGSGTGAGISWKRHQGSARGTSGRCRRARHHQNQ